MRTSIRVRDKAAALAVQLRFAREAERRARKQLGALRAHAQAEPIVEKAHARWLEAQQRRDDALAALREALAAGEVAA